MMMMVCAGKFEMMSLSADEDEHSIEMQLPYIAKVMAPARGNFTIVPVMVGSLSPSSEAKYGKIFAKYLKVSVGTRRKLHHHDCVTSGQYVLFQHSNILTLHYNRPI